MNISGLYHSAISFAYLKMVKTDERNQNGVDFLRESVILRSISCFNLSYCVIYFGQNVLMDRGYSACIIRIEKYV